MKSRDMAGTDESIFTGGELIGMMKLFKRTGWLVTCYVFAIICGVLPIIMSLMMGDMLNLFAETEDFTSKFLKVFYNLIYYNIGNWVANTAFRFFTTYANPYFQQDIRTAIYQSLMRQDVEYYDSVQTGTVLGWITGDVATINEVYITKMLTACQNVAQSVSGIILAFVTSWRVTLSVFIVYPISMAIFWYSEKLIKHLWFINSDSTSSAATQAEEVIMAFRTVKAFDQELNECERFAKSQSQITEVYDKVSIVEASKNGLITLLLHLMLVVFMYFGSWIILRRPKWGMENGDMMILNMSLIFAVIGLSQTMALADDFKKAKISASKILRLTNRKPKIDQRDGPVPETTVIGKIEFRNVSFRYNGREDYAVQNLSFTINAGETVALIGESGCGKSTTLQLLQRFYEIESGQILIDDVDITTYSPQYLRSQIAIVPQGPVLFTMDLAANIRYGRLGATSPEVAEAAEVGNAHNFIMEMPDNYKTVVEQTSLSGGQKQRVCISRAIVRNAPILLLDEATAALDTESEQLVQQSLERVRHGKTAVMVAHRLATVINSDRILVFKEGHIEEEGTHTDLLKQNGIYADLVKFQLQ